MMRKITHRTRAASETCAEARRFRIGGPPVRGHAALAHHIAAGLVADEFDLSYFQDKPLDHGCFSPLSMLWAAGACLAWRHRAAAGRRAGIPDSSRRAGAIGSGKACARAIESYPEDLKVVLVATGGLSHQVHGERCGFNNTEWDLHFSS